MAPEVLAGSLDAGVIATPASDVYMLGGLMFEVLTCGLTPYYWLNPALAAQVQYPRTGFPCCPKICASVGLRPLVNNIVILTMFGCSGDDMMPGSTSYPLASYRQ